MLGVSKSALEALITEFNASACECWTRGDLEAFLEGYAADAVMVADEILHSGREEIDAYYKASYADGQGMGIMEVEIVDIRFPNGSDTRPMTMATAILRTTLTAPDMHTTIGFSMVTYQLDDTGLHVVQDYWH
jgi:uncharacterized protein (TIGR02246 family)